MAIIIPTVLSTSIQEYNRLIDLLNFAAVLHIDVMDGKFAKPQSIDLAQAYWSADKTVHVHMMVDDPLVHIETLIAKDIDVVILHAESTTFSDAFSELQSMDQIVHVALLPETRPEDVPELTLADGCLIFGGKLGSYGGTADLGQLEKVEQVRSMNSELIFGWDGGANASNIEKLAAYGIEYINVGSAITKDGNPRTNYDNLRKLL